ncbi:alcohol dehydrogenase [Cladophialophora psammophila CBS 110553]|uniref:Alcohol dehydrogenase n=1 Tax=Cladophialophora psammophila CBS 110553 TaxID=1182543 RepID=W9XNE5_9EURO|nr:alcohol dehydrogenase [Cladophialophora psammophila CBS 110553]EXJ71849.1 alcohol dehydrogenase [Cladophialophora psammophila CBS 110553]
MASKEIPLAIRKILEHSKAEYKQLGKSGLRVSVPIFGCMGIGSSKWLPWVLDEDQVLPLLRAAFDRGINTWDTANVYSNGMSEEVVGKAIQKYKIPRDKLVLMTKCHGMVDDEPETQPTQYHHQLAQSKDFVNHFGLSRSAIFNAVQASLDRLKTNYIDLFQIHRFDDNVPIEETMETLHDLVKAGKVRYIGASSMWAYQFAMLQACAERNGWTKFISMQNHYSLLYREEEREMNKYCNLTGVGLIPWSPLYRGHLARPPSAMGTTTRSAGEKEHGDWFSDGLTLADEAIINRVQEVAEKHEWKMSSVSLAWIKKRVTSPIIGFSSEARMDEALDAKGKTLTEEEESYLQEPYESRPIQGHW